MSDLSLAIILTTVEAFDCPTCQASAGSACWTRGGRSPRSTTHRSSYAWAGAADLPTIAEELHRADIQLELLTGRYRGCTTSPRTGPRCSRSSPEWPSPNASTSGRSRQSRQLTWSHLPSPVRRTQRAQP
ncbi:zinc finger domain-containing protein [Nonomuraea indica]